MASLKPHLSSGTHSSTQPGTQTRMCLYPRPPTTPAEMEKVRVTVLTCSPLLLKYLKFPQPTREIILKELWQGHFSETVLVELTKTVTNRILKTVKVKIESDNYCYWMNLHVQLIFDDLLLDQYRNKFYTYPNNDQIIAYAYSRDATIYPLASHHFWDPRCYTTE